MRKNGGRQRLCVCVSFTFRCFRFFVSRLFFFFVVQILACEIYIWFSFSHQIVCLYVRVPCQYNCYFLRLCLFISFDRRLWHMSACVCAFFCLQFYAKHWRPLCSLIDLQWLVQFLATVHHFRWDQRIVLPSRARRRKKKIMELYARMHGWMSISSYVPMRSIAGRMKPLYIARRSAELECN